MARGKPREVSREDNPRCQNTFPALLQTCKSLSQAKGLHKRIDKYGLLHNKLISSLLIQTYGKFGAVDDARAVFDTLRKPNSHSWNFMIRIHALHNQHSEALSLFSLMRERHIPRDKFTFSSALAACSSPAALPSGKHIHRSLRKRGLESDVVLGTALISMYTKCDGLHDACDVFDRMPERNPVSWTTMINAYTQYDADKEALQLFHQMHMEGVLATLITCVSILKACSSLKNITIGKQVHLCLTSNDFEPNIKAINAIINMYAKCGSLEDACVLFNEAPERNVITWTSIITAYSQHGRGKEALQFYDQMERNRVGPNRVTYVSLVDACASMADVATGHVMHAHIVNTAFDDDIVIGTALVNMYGKCGNLDDARMLFKRMSSRNHLTWTAMIGAYTQHGHGKKALALFRRMRRSDVKPDSVTFVHVLSACSHSGLVEEGRELFSLMQEDYGIKPTTDHFSCMIDLLGKAGHLDEAEACAKSMPTEMSSLVPWRTMLGACKVQGDAERGEGVAEKVFELNPIDTAPYIILPNIYAADNKEV